MLSRNLTSECLSMVLNSLLSGGFLSEGGYRTLFINLVNKTFEECSVGSLKKINCIKAVRNCTGLGLKEAKDFTERYEKRMVSRDALVTRLERFTKYGDAIDPSLLNEWANESSQYHSVDVDELKQSVIEFCVDTQLEEDIPF